MAKIEYTLENYEEELMTVVLCAAHSLEFLPNYTVLREEENTNEPCDVCEGFYKDGETL